MFNFGSNDFYFSEFPFSTFFSFMHWKNWSFIIEKWILKREFWKMLLLFAWRCFYFIQHSMELGTYKVPSIVQATNYESPSLVTLIDFWKKHPNVNFIILGHYTGRFQENSSKIEHLVERWYSKNSGAWHRPISGKLIQIWSKYGPLYGRVFQ